MPLSLLWHSSIEFAHGGLVYRVVNHGSVVVVVANEATKKPPLWELVPNELII